MASDLRAIFARCRKLGWRVDYRDGGHIMLWPQDPSLPPVTASATPSSARAIRNLIADLRRSGFFWPHEGGPRRPRVAEAGAQPAAAPAKSDECVTAHARRPRVLAKVSTDMMTEVEMRTQGTTKLNEASETFAEALRGARAKAGLSSRDAAILLEVCAGTIHNWERGIGGLSLRSYEKLLNAYPELRDAPRPKITPIGRPRSAASGRGRLPAGTGNSEPSGETGAPERRREPHRQVGVGALAAVARIRAKNAETEDFVRLIKYAADESLSACDIVQLLGLDVA